MSLIKQISNDAELDKLLASQGSGLTVIDFMAAWCAPCHAIAPLVEALSKQYKHVAFCKVDIDQLKNVASKYKIRAVPTFVFIKSSEVLHEIRGANPKGIQDSLVMYAGAGPPVETPQGQSSTSKETGAGGTSTSGAAAASSKESDSTEGLVSLLEFLDPPQLNCLNESDSHSIKTIISSKGKTVSTSYLESDADEQLLLNIYFNQTVRIRALVVHSKDSGRAPKKIKLFTNKPSIGFEDVEDAEEPEAAQVMELVPATVEEGKPVGLRFVRFQHVNSLHIFVASNQGGDDVTRIDSIDVLGLPVETTKMSNLKKNEEE